MKLRVYQNDWFLNMGIVGFMTILEKADKLYDSVIIKDNYLEFDSKLLQDFSGYYFQYFMDEYRISDRLKRTLQLGYCILSSLSAPNWKNEYILCVNP